MNSGALAGDALAAQLDDVAHLVDEEQHHEADRELPAPDQAVGRDRDEHRARVVSSLSLGSRSSSALPFGADARAAAATMRASRLPRPALLGGSRRQALRERAAVGALSAGVG